MSRPTRFQTASVKVHRYLGILIAVFLILIAGTGSIIAWYRDLENHFNAPLRIVTPQPQGWRLQDALRIRERLEAQDPRSHVFSLQFPQRPEQSLFSRVMPAIDPATDEPYNLDYDEVFANPYTGERLGQRLIGQPTVKGSGFFSFVYYLHYALLLPLGTGILLIGFFGLLWAMESMIGLYLTLPPKLKPSKNGAKQRSFMQRWSTSWKISKDAPPARRLLDLHRASGLWLWPLLLMFAVTGFALNLGGIYAAAVNVVAPYTHFQERPPVPALERPLLHPAIDWFQAAELGQRYFAEQAKRQGFTLGKPAAIEYRRDLGVYFFLMHTSRDVLDAQGNPTETDSPATAATIAIDARNGRYLGLQLPTGQNTANTITSWMMALHVAAIGGRPWQIAVSVFGMLVVGLSLTGLLLWWRRRKTRKSAPRPKRSQ